MKQRLKQILPYVLFAFCLSSLNFIGYYLMQRANLIGIIPKSIARLILETVLQTIIYALLTYCIAMFLKKHTPAVSTTTACKQTKLSMLLDQPYICMAILIVIYLTALLAYFPGVYSYDANVQLEQWIYQNFDRHHPLIHTLFMGICYEAGSALSSLTPIHIDGMLFYSILQITVLSWCIDRGYRLLKRLSAASAVKIAYIAYFSLFPFFPIMAVSITKDTLFTAFFIWFTALTYEIAVLKDALTVKKVIVYILVGIFMMLLRHNGIYTILFMCAVTVLYTLKSKRDTRKFLATNLSAIALYLIISGAMTAALDAGNDEKKELFSVPLQQIARTYTSHNTEMTPEEFADIFYYLPQKGCEHYRPLLSDPVKMHFEEDHYKADRAGFFRMYFHNMLKHPDSYALAALYITMGYWYPLDESHTLVYADWWRDRVCYLMTDDIPVFMDDYVVKAQPVPLLTKYYELFATKLLHKHIPFINLIFIPATYSILLAVMTILCIRKKHWDLLIVLLPTIGYLITCLLGPGAVMRYAMPLMGSVWLCMLLFCVCPNPERSIPQ